MIVDCHSQVWASGTPTEGSLPQRPPRGQAVSALPAEHAQAARCVSVTLVAGLVGAADLDAVNHFVAQHVAKNARSMIGVAVVNPLADDALDQAQRLLARPEFKALAISPATQGFHPCHSRAMKLYELAQARRAPVLLMHGAPFPRQARMEFARPSLLDEVAIAFPDLTMVLSGLGQPWVDEAVALIGRHPRVFADVAGLTGRPWQAYNALMLAHQFDVMDKLLFGSGFPFATPAQAIEGLYRLHELTQGGNLPSVPREMLRSVVERDAPAALGIPWTGAGQPLREDDVISQDARSQR